MGVSPGGGSDRHAARMAATTHRSLASFRSRHRRAVTRAAIRVRLPEAGRAGLDANTVLFVDIRAPGEVRFVALRATMPAGGRRSEGPAAQDPATMPTACLGRERAGAAAPPTV